MPNEYLIRHGDVYDGRGDTPKQVDIHIRGGAIVEIGPDLAVPGALVIDGSGLLITPGLIDLHVHVFTGMGIYSIAPEDAGLRTGVTMLLDTGSAGSFGMETFYRLALTQGPEDVFALVNISQLGVQGRPTVKPCVGELDDVRYVHTPSAVASVEQFRDRVIGTKVRLTATLAADKVENERAGLRSAIAAAEETGVPCMVHHSLSNIPVGEVMETLRPGDIYTHCFHPHADNAFQLDGGAGVDVYRGARDRGIFIDVGHGVGSFGWESAERACLEHGFWPDTISTDLHQFNLHGPVFDLPTTMSKFLYLGMPLGRIIQAVTSSAARAMGLVDRFGVLEAGRQADVTLLRRVDGEFDLVDVEGAIRKANQRLLPVAVFKNGVYRPCQNQLARDIVKSVPSACT